METKKCSKCGVIKPHEDFAIKKASKDGRNSRCKECDKMVSAQYRSDNPEKANLSSKKSKQKHSEAVKDRLKKHYSNNAVRIMDQMKEALKKNPANGLFKLAKGRAKKKGLPFEIKVEDIVVPEFCPILGIKMEFGDSKSRGNSPSLDRIKPELGYIHGNIAVISYRANRIKNDATADEHRRIADWMDAQKQEAA